MKKAFLFLILAFACTTGAMATLTKRVTINLTATNGASDVLTLIENTDYTSGFDQGYDVVKITNSLPMNIYVYLEDGTYLSTLATNDLTNTPLEVDGGGGGETCELLFSNVVGTMFLKDVYNGTETLIVDSGTYNFTYYPNAASEIGTRFFINYNPTYYINLGNEDQEWLPMTQSEIDGTWSITGVYPGNSVCVNTMPQTNELMSCFDEGSWNHEESFTPQANDTLAFRYTASDRYMWVQLIGRPIAEEQEEQEEEDEPRSVTITMTTPAGSSDVLTLIENTDYTSGFDQGADVQKIMNSAEDGSVVNIYACMADGTNLSTLATDDLTNITMYAISSATEADWSLTFTNVVGDITLHNVAGGENDLTPISEGMTISYRDLPNEAIQWEFVINYVPEEDPEEPVTTLTCLVQDSTLYVVGQDDIVPTLLNGSGDTVELVWMPEQFEDGGQYFDISMLPAGHYTLVTVDGRFIFDKGLQGVTYTIAADDCMGSATDFSTYINLGETYLLGCERITPTADYSTTSRYTGSNGCDSLVNYIIQVVGGEEPEQPVVVTKSICADELFLVLTGYSTWDIVDSAGVSHSMLPAYGSLEDGETLSVDLSPLSQGRYTAYVDNEVYLFDHSLPGVKTVEESGNGCLTRYTMTTTIYEGEVYLFNCEVITATGQYTMTITGQSEGECSDSIAILNLAVVQPIAPCESTEQYDSVRINANELPYSWQGQELTEAGDYSVTLESTQGCDSILNLTLYVQEVPCEPVDSTEMVMICEGETYSWHKMSLTKSGTYYDTLLTIAGCDSICILQLTVNPKYLIEDIVSVREDQLPYIWQGQSITESGDYVVEYISSKECDSIHTLHFTVTALPIYTVNVLADHGHVNGTGTYPEGTQITLTAVPDEGFEFQMWSDGTTTNPKNFTVMQDTTFRALFYMPEVEQEVVVDSIETNSVVITWDTVPGATLYELRIYKNGELVVTLQIDADNNIINTEFAGPDRLIARKDSTGGSSETLQVNVSGLEAGQDYTYSLDALDDDRSYVGAQSGSFTTEEEPINGLEQTEAGRPETDCPRKVLRDGRLYILLPDGTLYDARGSLAE